MSLNQRIYTDSPDTQLTELILQTPLDEETRRFLATLAWAFDYKTLSTTNLSKKDLNVLSLRLRSLMLSSMMQHPTWQKKSYQFVDAFTVLTDLTAKRSQDGFLIKNIFGKRLSSIAINDVNEQKEKKKKRFGVF